MTGPVMRRAGRKNTLGKSIDTICGYVRGKTHQAKTLEIGRFYILSKTTRHTSSLAEVTLSPRPRTAISAIEKRVMDNFY